MKLKRTIAVFLAAVMASTPVLCGCEKITAEKKKSFAAKYSMKEDENNTPGTIDYTKGESVLTLDADPDSEDESERFDAFVNELFIDMHSGSIASVHYSLEHPEDYGIKADSYFGDVDELLNYDETIFDKMEEGLKSFNPDLLGDNQRMMYKLLSYEVAMYRRGQEFETDYVCPYFDQDGEVLSNLQSVLTEYSLQEEKDVEDFIGSLKEIPAYLENVKPLITASVVDNNELLTQTMYDNAIESADSWITDGYEDNIIYVAFSENVKEVGLDAETEEEYLSEVADIVEESTIPAIEDFKDFVTGFEDEIDEAKGLACFEGGKDYYSYLMEAYIGVGCSVDEMYAYSLSALKEVITGMQELEDKHPEYLKYGFESKYGDDPDEILSALAELSAEEFPDVGELSWICSYLKEEQTEDHVVAYYMHPQLDNIRRNVIRVNKKSIDDPVELFITLAHEGIPGHLYQQQYEYNDVPYEEVNIGLAYLSYSEGWAVYSEKLAYEWCLDDADAALYCYYDGIFFYLFATCIDILVNYYGYSREKVNEWMNNLGYSSGALYDFVVSDPCLYTYYGLGPILVEDTLNELADDGRDTKTCYKDFLDIGPAPFTIVWEELGIENPMTKRVDEIMNQ